MARTRRCDVINEEQVGTYHCINRCVRRAYLCGRDAVTRRSYNHRKQWLQDRLQKLAGLFAVDIMAFAVLSNHFHLVVRNRPDVTSEWTDQEVARRWIQIYPHRAVGDADSVPLAAARVDMLANQPTRIAELRRRLSSISWFMKCLAEPLARWANAEDSCAGRFWQGRFRCQALLDEGAVAACMTYVDLNPVRAGLAATPAQSRFTSASLRRQALRENSGFGPHPKSAGNARGRGSRVRQRTRAKAPQVVRREKTRADSWLSPIPLELKAQASSTDEHSASRASDRGCLDMQLADYLKLLDWAASLSRSSHSRSKLANAPRFLQRFGLEPAQWSELMRNFSRLFRLAAGNPASLALEAERRGCHWIQGLGTSRRIFGRSSA